MPGKYYLTTNPHPRIAGKLLAIITQGHPQAGDKEVKVCSVNAVGSLEEASNWYDSEMRYKPWEKAND